MIAYMLDGANPGSASVDPRMDRLRNAGPWQYQYHQEGSIATWRRDGPAKMSSFGPTRKTTDGLLYFSPKVLPTPAELFRPAFLGRADLHEVIVSQDLGTTIAIMPVFRSPRQILEDNTLGDYSTIYGKLVRGLLDRVREKPDTKMNEVMEELAECCRAAIMWTYRTTKELLQDLGWLNEESIMPIWEATIQIPKELLSKEKGS